MLRGAGRLVQGWALLAALLCTLGPVWAQSPGAAAAVDDPASLVRVTLTGGSLKAGRARVEARVENGGTRALLGLRLAAYYDPLDALPAPDAAWRQHEFLLEPPLAPGSATALGFADDNAAEFVLLRCAYARFALGLSLDGGAPLAAQAELLEVDGRQYIAARDLAAVLDAKLTQAADKRVTLALPAERGGRSLAYRPGSTTVALGAGMHELAAPVLERDGRSWLPLHDVCALLGFEADYDLGANLLNLTSAPSADM